MTMNKEKRSTKDIVFKCTYNDGGVGQNGIGFTKTCNDALIKQHIKDKKAWCSNDGCPCKNYIDGEISYSEREQSYDSGARMHVMKEACL